MTKKSLDTEPAPPRKSRLFRSIGWAVVGVLVLYYGGVNLLLASPLAEKLFNYKPELVQIHYQRAWTLIPLQVEVRGFRLSIQDRLVQLEITADEVNGNIHAWTLLSQRFVGTHLTGSGVAMRVRPRMTKGDPREAFVSEMPPIEGYPTPIRDQTHLEAQIKDIKYMGLELVDVTIHHLKEVWIDRIRYQGDAELTGGMMYEPFQKMRLDNIHLVDAKAEFTAADRAKVTIDTIDARATLGEVDLNAFDLKALSTLDAEVKAAVSAPPSFLNGYLSNISGLSSLAIGGEMSRLELNASVTKGVLAAGDVLSYQTPLIKARLPFVDVSGSATVRASVAQEKLSVDVDIAKAAVQRRDGAHLLDAQHFGIDTISSPDLTKLLNVDAVLKLKGGRAKNLQAFNVFIPDGAGVRFNGGKANVEGTLKLDSAPAKASGHLDIDSDNVAVANRRAIIQGHLEVHGVVRSLDLKTNALDLSGSTVAVTDATLKAQSTTWKGIWLKASTPSCRLTPKGKVQWETTLNVDASNLQPLVTVVSVNSDLPKALTLLLNSPDVHAEATLQVRTDGVELPRMILKSKNIQLEGALSLKEREDKALEPWGGLLAHAGILNVGIELNGPKVSLVFSDLANWAATKKQIPLPNSKPKD